MVFVTVGNATQGFRRLLEAVDRLAGEGLFAGEVVWAQSGSNPDLRLSHCVAAPFFTMDDFVARVREADLIIAHAGAGTLWHVFQAGKVPVVMPRRKKYGEVVDDHQVELVRALAADGRVIPAYEPDDLPPAIAEARRRGARPRPDASVRINDLVAAAIQELLERPGGSQS